MMLRTAPTDIHPSLVEELARRGYVTGCFTDNPHLAPDSRLVSGFDHVERSVGRWRQLLSGTVLGEVVERLDPGDDRRLVGRALGWAARTRGPFFLYVHLMDAHTPYRHPRLSGRRRPGRRVEFPTPGLHMRPAEIEDVIARYDGGIRSTEAQAARFLGAAAGWGRPYVALVTADHGESLGESGRWFHGGSLAPELLAVPLMVLGDGVQAGRVTAPVGHAAIPSTLLASAGASGPHDQSADLRTAPGGGVVTGGLPPTLAYRIADGFKLVVRRPDGERRLFDVRADPEEKEDISARFPERTLALSLGLDPGGAMTIAAPDLSERLRSLGYLGSRE